MGSVEILNLTSASGIESMIYVPSVSSIAIGSAFPIFIVTFVISYPVCAVKTTSTREPAGYKPVLIMV